MKRLWLAILGLVSWLSGFCGYNLILWFVWKQTDADLIPALLITGIAFFVIQLPLCLMSIRVVNRVIYHFKWLFFPLGCLISFIVPTVLIFACKGGHLQMIYSKDSVSFITFFLVSTVVFGLGYWLVHKKVEKTQTLN